MKFETCMKCGKHIIEGLSGQKVLVLYPRKPKLNYVLHQDCATEAANEWVRAREDKHAEQEA